MILLRTFFEPPRDADECRNTAVKRRFHYRGITSPAEFGERVGRMSEPQFGCFA